VAYAVTGPGPWALDLLGFSPFARPPREQGASRLRVVKSCRVVSCRVVSCRVVSCRFASTRADPNPSAQFASPSIDMPYMPNQGGIRIPGLTPPGPVPFEQQPNLGGLGIMGQQAGAGMYYQGGMVSVDETERGRDRANRTQGHDADVVSQGGMYARAGYHA
jgi:hypothetical protein